MFLPIEHAVDIVKVVVDASNVAHHVKNENNQLSGLPFREFESHLLRHFYFQESLAKSKTPLTSGVFAFLLSGAIDRNVPV